jgi:hypothetical protein
MRTFVTGAAMLAAAALGTALLLEIDISMRVDRVRETHGPATELGEPNLIWKSGFDCPRGWDCEACVRLKSELRSDEEVYLFGRFTAFFVVVGPDGHVRRSARCGS